MRPSHHEQEEWLGHVAHKQHRLQDALQHLREAQALEPGSTFGLVTLASLYLELGGPQQALEYAQQAWQAEPKNMRVMDVLASSLSALYRYDEAIQIFDHLTDLAPDQFVHWNNAGNMRRELGLLDEAYRCYQKASELAPHNAIAYSNHLTALHYDPRASRAEIAAFAKSWEKRFAPKADALPSRPTDAVKSYQRPLNVGLLSDGFRKHPVGKMIVRCLENLPPNQLELVAYTSSEVNDSLTRRIKPLMQKWRSIQHLSDDDLIQLIRDDEIDILIDLSGHNAGTRMRAIAMQPAPLIVKWVGGLINTTGVQAIDYLISDHVETPEGEDEYYTEKLIRLPGDYIVFEPPEDLPALGELPAKRNGYVTLACFNNPTKLNDVTLKQWASIMHELPDSRLLLKGRPYTSESFCERLYTLLENEGIARERLIIEGPGTNHEMLDAYNRADIALDPWPYSGGLTTCEAFIMGVPVVTLPGPTFAGRHSATHLVNAGMPELVVNSWEEYRARVIGLASDLDSLSTIRQHLRDVLLQSPVCDGPRFAKHFTDAMRAIWQRYCDDKAPTALTFNKEGEARFEDEDAPVNIHYAEAPADNSRFQWQFEGKLIAVDNGGQLLESDVVRQLLQKEVLELIAFDPSSQALDTSLKQYKGVHYYPNATLGDGQPGQLYACLDPNLSASLAPLGDEHQPEAIRKGSQVLTRLPLNTIALDSIQGLPAIDWLVLDALNDAAAILDNGTQALKETLLLQVEVAFQPTHERQPNLAELQHWASRNGFRFYRLHEPQHRSHLPEDIPETQRQATELTSADALLLPSHARMETLSDNQRTRLAFLLHTAYGVKDMAYALLASFTGGKKAEKYLAKENLAVNTNTPETPSQLNSSQDLKSVLEESEHFYLQSKEQLEETVSKYEKALTQDPRDNISFFLLIQAIKAKPAIEHSLDEKLKSIGWSDKRSIFQYWFSYHEVISKVESPRISIIVVSAVPNKKVLECLKALNSQGKNIAQIIFVSNGPCKDDFPLLNSYVNNYIQLKGNAGASHGRNVGALFANSPLLLFVDDDGLPEKDFISSHIAAHANNNILSVRGKCLPFEEGTIPPHYNPSKTPCIMPVNLEGNSSYKSIQFYAIGGWEDRIMYGHEGLELAYRLLKLDYDQSRQIYHPKPCLRHNYYHGSAHLETKMQRLAASSFLISHIAPGWDKVKWESNKTSHKKRNNKPAQVWLRDKNALDLNYMIVGCGRSGTKSMAELLTKSGLNIVHENYFRWNLGTGNKWAPGSITNTFNKEYVASLKVPFELDGESSWLAAPFIDMFSDETKFIYLVRDPIKVISSFYDLGVMHKNSLSPSIRFAQEIFSDINTDDELYNSISYYFLWNNLISEKIKKKKSIILNIESLDTKRAEDFLGIKLNETPHLNTKFSEKIKRIEKGRILETIERSSKFSKQFAETIALINKISPDL